MKHEKRSKWSSQATFILAAIGSAVGLGNAWRFPGLAAKHGGGTYLLIYLVALFVVGIPLLMMEVSVARKFHRGAGESMRGINKKTEFIGWAATSNAFVISGKGETDGIFFCFSKKKTPGKRKETGETFRMVSPDPFYRPEPCSGLAAHGSLRFCRIRRQRNDRHHQDRVRRCKIPNGQIVTQ